MAKARKKKKKKFHRRNLLPLIGFTGAVAYFAGVKSGFRTQADMASGKK